MKKLKAVVLGYGNRGMVYAKYALQHPEQMEVVAVSEPVANKREYAKKVHNLADDRVFEDWKELAEFPRLADFAIIATQDNMHYKPALALIEKGYNLLLEKPIAPTPKECKEIAEAAEKKGVKIVVCHVMRFSSFWNSLKEIVVSGEIGELMSIMHLENVGNIHQSHSFVRGNWRNSNESAPMILAKSCHDTDILQWLIGKACLRVQSFGSLTHFRSENRPEGAPDYCVQGCPIAEECFYNAVKLYYDDKENVWFRTVATDTVDPTDEDVMKAIKTGPYGRCVYNCDNNVVDHQVVNMEFEGGCTVSFTMNAFNEGGRFIRVFGTKGEIYGDMENNTLEIYSFKTKKTKTLHLENSSETLVGHGDGDERIMSDLVSYFNGESSSKAICDIRTSYMNHLISFAAEESRVNSKIVDLRKYSDEL